MRFSAYFAMACALQIHAFGIDAPEQSSKVGAVAIANALDRYYADHNRLPGRAGPDAQTETSHGSPLVKVLMGKEGPDSPRQNPRNKNYLEGVPPAKPGLPGLPILPGRSEKWVGGVVMDGTACSMVDPWGNYYQVKLDSNFDGKLANPAPPAHAAGRSELSGRAVVWSAGKDGTLETWGDNVKSWD